MHAMIRTCALCTLIACGRAAGHEIVIPVADFQLSGGTSLTFDVDVVDPFDFGSIEFIYFQGFFDNAGEDGSLASDLQLTLAAPNGATTVIGGFDHFSEADHPWEFQGDGEFAGFYSSFLFDPIDPAPLPDGVWTITFTHDRFGAADHLWTDVQLWLIPSVPAPGALALLPLALLGARRRRRTS